MFIASFNGGNPVIGLLLLPFFFAGPFLLIWLEVRAFLKSDTQSLLILLLMLALGGLAGFYAIGSISEFNRTMGFWKTHLVAAWLGVIGLPPSVGWEAYKRGLLSGWKKPSKGNRRRGDVE